MVLLRRIAKTIWDEFVYGGHLQSVGCSGIAYAIGYLLRIRVTFDFLLVVYLLVYPIYLFNRYKELELDYLTNKERTEHYLRYRRYLPSIIAISCLVLFAFAFHYCNLLTVAVLGVLLVLGFLYTLTVKRITRYIPVLKNIYVAFVFAKITFLMFLYYSVTPTKAIWMATLVLTLLVFLKGFIMQIFLDIKDIESDSVDGLRTIPIMIGAEPSHRMVQWLNVVACLGFPYIFSVTFHLLNPAVWGIAITIPIYYLSMKMAQDSKYAGYLIVSGEFLYWAPSVWLAGHMLGS